VKDVETLIAAYETDVQFPDVSGMEHLEMLLVRSDIARSEDQLTAEQRARLAKADQALLWQARRFHRAIQRIADLETWRREQDVPPTSWWWYLDVLAQLPEQVAPGPPVQAVPA
jgi:hypothetical protein